jgi:hypothetical protein
MHPRFIDGDRAETYRRSPVITGEGMAMSTATSDAVLVFMGEITRDCGVTDRAVRKWVTTGTFPAPDGNLNGRNFWNRATYRKWQDAVQRGEFRRASSLPTRSGEPRAA